MPWFEFCGFIPGFRPASNRSFWGSVSYPVSYPVSDLLPTKIVLGLGFIPVSYPLSGGPVSYSVSYRFHTGFIVGFIPESEKAGKRRFRAKREAPQRIKVGASFRFHTGFIPVS